MKYKINLIFSFIFINSQAQELIKDSIDYNPIEIKEVLIQSQRKKMFADKSVYIFNKEALEKARYAKDLLNTLPELYLDPISNTIQSTKGGTTLILINGIEATDNQIRSIKPQDVVRVEYFDIPPARYSTRADQVVNLITHNPENGYVFGIEGITSPLTGFVDGSVYANFTRGKNNFAVEYLLSLRDYDNRENTNSYAYQLNNNQYKITELRFDHFGYTFQNAILRYTNTDSDKYTFQTKLNLDIFTSFTDVNGESIFLMNNFSENHTSYKHGNNSYTKPTVDLYYSRKLGKNDELSLNFVGSIFNTETFELSKEWVTSNGNSVFNNEMKLKAEQTSIVGEVAHTHVFKSGKLNSGYRITTNDINNDLMNLEGSSRYKVNYLQQYIYTDFTGKTKKLMYRLGIGLTNIHNKSADDTQDTWTITPKLVLGYELAKNQSLRFTSSYSPTSPWSDALSSNVVQIVPNIVRKGNPELNIQKSFLNNLIYSFNTKYFDLNTNLFYRYRKDAINQLYVLDGNRYALTYENVQNSKSLGVQVSGSIKPFETDLLTLKIVLTPTTESLKLSNGKKIKNDYLGNNFILSSVYKNFSLMYAFNIPVYSLGGPFLDITENKSDLVLGYKWNNWSFKTGVYWLGMPSEYKSRSVSESILQTTNHTQIWNNKNMFILGFSYDFEKGKNTNIKRKLENETAESASF